MTLQLNDSPGTPPGSGALFGVALAPQGRGLYYVDDSMNETSETSCTDTNRRAGEPTSGSPASLAAGRVVQEPDACVLTASLKHRSAHRTDATFPALYG